MNKALQHIRDRIRNIQFGILRCRDKDLCQTWQVKASPAEDNLLHCVINGDKPEHEMIDRDVNLIQKYKDDYLFISGTVAAAASTNVQVLSIRVVKACWFEKKSRGAVSWLKEKYVYENLATPIAS